MRILWTEEALDDLAEIFTHYVTAANPRTAESIERRIVEQIRGLPPFPERIRKSDCVPGTRELVVKRLPYVVFVKLTQDEIIVLNVVHTARKFPVY